MSILMVMQRVLQRVTELGESVKGGGEGDERGCA